MGLTIQHTHTYDCWKTIGTLLLEKDAGNPTIDQLRTIHLYIANYNLLLKWFSSQGFILKSKKAHWITKNQGGGCPGHSTIDLALPKVLSYKVAKTLQLWVIIVDNDTTACFNSMVKPQTTWHVYNMVWTHYAYIKLHAQTQKELQYHLKHKYGISPDFNSHQEIHPWYGMGQGSRDGCNWWVIGTDSVTDADNEEAHQWKIRPPDGTSPVTQSINAFIDDVHLFIGKQPDTTKEQFLSQAQQDIHCWHGILCTTGGKLNVKKCFWSNFHLEYDKKGNPTICQQTPDNPQLHLLNPNGTQKTLHSPPSLEGIQHLGVHISMDGNKKTEEQMLIKCCQLFQKVYHQCPLTHHKAEVTHKTILLPMVTYPLPATTCLKRYSTEPNQWPPPSY